MPDLSHPCYDVKCGNGGSCVLEGSNGASCVYSSSCSSLLQQKPYLHTGYYPLNVTGTVSETYCDMETRGKPVWLEIETCAVLCYSSNSLIYVFLTKVEDGLWCRVFLPPTKSIFSKLVCVRTKHSAFPTKGQQPMPSSPRKDRTKTSEHSWCLTVKHSFIFTLIYFH